MMDVIEKRGDEESEEAADRPEYVNNSRTRFRSLDDINTKQAAAHSGGKGIQLVFVLFGLLCITQATLNVGLRLYFYADAKCENVTSERDEQTIQKMYSPLGGPPPGRRSLVFLVEAATNYITVTPLKPLDMGAFTLCMRLATELKGEREIILFAYRTRAYDELNLWRELDGRIGMYLSGDGVIFEMPPLGALQSHLCITWDSSSGATAVFMDGKKSLTKIYQRGHRVRSGGKVIIGQDPDEYVGGFDAIQSFVGEISDINLWSRVLPDSTIRDMASTGITTENGDVIDWSSVNLDVTGNVNIINSDM